MNGDDVWMIKRGRSFCFLDKTAQAALVIGKLRRQQLQCDFAIELRIIGEIDLTHAAFSEWCDDLIVSHDLPCDERRLRFRDHFRSGLISSSINETVCPPLGDDQSFGSVCQVRTGNSSAFKKIKPLLQR